MPSDLLPISSARSAGKRLGLRSVIVLQELPDGRWGYTSWGRTKADCGRAKLIADEVLETARLEVLWQDTRGAG